MEEILSDLRRKVKFHLRDISMLDNEIDEMIKFTIEDIARETKVFRKICGFTVESDKQLYDFLSITRMNEEVEEELENVYIGGITDIAIKAMLLGRDTWPNPITVKKEFEETAMSSYLSADAIFDPDLRNVMNKFKYTSTNIYIVKDQQWLEDNDGVEMALIYTVIPNLEEMQPEHINMIEHIIIEGCKYYVANTLGSGDDANIANLYYQRFWQKKQDLINSYPTKVVLDKSYMEEARWL